jgi:hydrogenase maturation factor
MIITGYFTGQTDLTAKVFYNVNGTFTQRGEVVILSENPVGSCIYTGIDVSGIQSSDLVVIYKNGIFASIGEFILTANIVQVNGVSQTATLDTIKAETSSYNTILEENLIATVTVGGISKKVYKQNYLPFRQQ